jgi:hypothetical protein
MLNDISRDKGKLLEKNKKLQEQIRDLAKAADAAFMKELQRRQQAIEGDLHLNQDERVQRKMREIKRQQEDIERYKYEIIVLKRQLENVFDQDK